MDRGARWLPEETRHIRQSIMEAGPSRWMAAGGGALAAAILWYVYAECYCSVPAARAQAEPVHLDSVANSCVVLTTPEAWQTPDGEMRDRRRRPSGEYRDIFDNYELRQSRTGSLLYIALRSKQATGFRGLPSATGIRNSTNRFALEIQSSGEDGGRRIALQSIRPASLEEWDAADPLGFSPVGEPAAHSSSLSPPDTSPIAAIGNGTKWSVRTLVWGGPKDSLLYDLIWYAPPTYASAVFYASGTRSGEVRVWACSNLLALIRDAATHANAYLTVPISEDQRKLVLCQIGSPPARDVTAAADPEPTGN